VKSSSGFTNILKNFIRINLICADFRGFKQPKYCKGHTRNEVAELGEEEGKFASGDAFPSR
jgi:hypothetical protein